MRWSMQQTDADNLLLQKDADIYYKKLWIIMLQTRG